MSKTIIASDRAPQAIGPYSQAVRVGELVLTSGQIGLDPATGALVEGGVEAEAVQVLTNLTEVLAAAGASWQDVLKTTIYLTDMADFAKVNQIYGERVGASPPARSTVEVSGLPKGARIEIDAIAHLGGGK